MIAIVLFFIFLCWGSFLNVVAYRIILDKSIVFPGSFCPQCNHALAWYDLIPVISYILLQGQCRYCTKKISLLYPFIELFTAASLTILYFVVPPQYFLAYFIFISALIVTIRSDLETMMISAYASWLLVPLGFLFSYFDFLPISLLESFLACFGSGLFLYAIAQAFYYFTNKQGLGFGDIQLIAFIGAFIGLLGVWFTILLGSIAGLLVGGGYLVLTKKTLQTKIPFGPFLAGAAIVFVLVHKYILLFICAYPY